MLKFGLSVLFIFIVLLAFLTRIEAKEQTATLRGEVAAGDAYTGRLRNLPKGASLSIDITVSGEIRILLLDPEDARRWPAVEQPLFEGNTSDRMGFALKVPRSGHYFVILDNRDGDAARTFTLRIQGSTEGLSQSAVESDVQRAHDELAKFKQKLREIFVFDELTLRVGRCGTENAFSGDNVVTICAEVGPMLLKRLKDEKKAQDALNFMMLHEIGHVLLRQWGYPFFDNEEVADEFATVLMVMFNHKERIHSVTELFQSFDPERELQLKRERDDRHPLSLQRARNIKGWMEDPDLVRRWQKILVPHMETDALQALQWRPKSWTDADAVEDELSRRRQ